jgi:multidrug efflux pump subunit AcrB
MGSLLPLDNLFFKGVMGLDAKKAVGQASLDRFRPIIITSLTTIAKLLLRIFEQNLQAQSTKTDNQV